jgi:two-component system chemotaxis response regulator CheY
VAQTRVLIVDDDSDLRSFVVDALEFSGYAVDTAEHGRAALDQVRRARPDLVLLDMMMPVMDGWAFLQECSKDDSCRKVPVVVVSAAASVQPTSANSLGVQAVLKKPFGLDDLVAVVERHVTPQ